MNITQIAAQAADSPATEGNRAESPTPQNSTATPAPKCFLDMAGLMTNVPLSERTIRDELHKGRLPHIKLPGSRRLLFHWPTVEKALLRFQVGGDK